MTTKNRREATLAGTTAVQHKKQEEVGNAKSDSASQRGVEKNTL